MKQSVVNLNNIINQCNHNKRRREENLKRKRRIERGEEGENEKR